jgi:hypothetical protein
MTVPTVLGRMLLGIKHITFTIVLSVDHNTVWNLMGAINCDLDFSIRIDPNVKYFSVLGKPSVGPPTIIADSDGSNRIDDEFWGGLWWHELSPGKIKCLCAITIIIALSGIYEMKKF